MRILALDLGGGTGVAVDGTEEWKPLLVPVRLPSAKDGDYGPGGWLLWRKLCGLIETHQPQLIAYERPSSYGAHAGETNQNTQNQQVGRAYLVDTIAAKYGLHVRCAPVATIRKHFVGRGYPDDAKRVVYERCRQLGWRPPDHNCSDAAAVWDYMKSQFSPGWGARVTPLMMHDEAL